jgi:hypothetical protein
MLQVNARCGFIQHQQIWFTGKRSGDQHSLLLPTRQSRNVGVELVGQSNEGDGVVHGVPVGSAEWSERPPSCQPSCGDNLFHL